MYLSTVGFCDEVLLLVLVDVMFHVYLKINLWYQIAMYFFYAGTAMKTGVIQGLTRINKM